MKNRTIKFRVWDVDSSDMIQHKDLIMGDIYLQVSEEGMRVVMDDPEGENGPEVREAIIMQFTGLKDKHGKEIYDGDILNWDFCGSVQWSEWMAKPIYKVQYYNGYLPAAVGIYKELFLHAYRFQYTEVLGNIYENPDLCQ